jgi:predicted dehydrogenase
VKPVTTDPGRVWRWGFLAAAGISEKRAAQLGSVPGCTLHAVAARDGERAEAFAQKHGASRAYAGYDALLQDSEVDCVYLAMPGGLRAPWVERAARSGKHVLCEKPAAGSVDELIGMLEVCEDHGVLFMDGTVFVHNTRGPGGIREDLTEAVGGRIDAAHFRLSVGCTDGIRVNGLEPLGCLGDLGWYGARWGLALSAGCPPSRVECRMEHNDAGVPVAVEAALSFGFPYSMRCDFAGEPHRPSQSLRVEGPGGEVEIRDLFRLSDRAELSCPDAPVRLLADFVACLEAGDPRGFGHWHAEALRTQKILDACVESDRTGRPAPNRDAVPVPRRVAEWQESRETQEQVALQRARAAGAPARSGPAPESARRLVPAYAETGSVVLEAAVAPADMDAVKGAFDRLYRGEDSGYNRLQSNRPKFNLDEHPLRALALEKLAPALRATACILHDRTFEADFDPLRALDVVFINVDVAEPGCAPQRPHWDKEAGDDWTFLTVPLVDMDEENGPLEIWPATEDLGSAAFPAWSRVSMPCGGPPDSAPDHVGNMERQLSGVFPELEAVAERMLHLRCRTRLGDVILRRPSGWHRGTENRGDDPRPVLTICVVPRAIRPPRPRRRGWRFWRRGPAGG